MTLGVFAKRRRIVHAETGQPITGPLTCAQADLAIGNHPDGEIVAIKSLATATKGAAL